MVVALLAVGMVFRGVRRFRGHDRPKTWPTFTVPDAGFSVRLPTSHPAEADLSLTLIDPAGPDAEDRTQAVRTFVSTVGKIQGWTAEDDGTRYSIRVHIPNGEFANRAKGLLADLFRPGRAVGDTVTNFRVIDEGRTDKNGIDGRVILAERPDGSRILIYLFQANGRAVFLFVERPGGTLHIDDAAAGRFFASVHVR
jgi:hypothetical protein